MPKFNANPHLQEIIRILSKYYGHAECALHFRNPFELLVATILSAQCTDKKVNEVTPELFRKFPTPDKMAAAPLEKIQSLIRPTGFYRQKAKSLKSMSRSISTEYDGEIPQNIENLVQLPGVGRKTANVVLGNAFQSPAGIVVDTHVRRISNLLGLTQQENPEKIEQELNKLIPQKHWVDFPHWLIHHGRQICIARRPKCLECPLLSVCPRIGLPALSKVSIKTAQRTVHKGSKIDKKKNMTMTGGRSK